MHRTLSVLGVEDDNDKPSETMLQKEDISESK